MRPVVFIVPGRMETRTGGYEYDRRIVAGLRKRGWSVTVRELDASFPYPSPAALNEAARALAAIPNSCPGGPVAVVDGLLFGAMPVQVEQESSRLKFVAIVHLPLAEHVGLESAVAARLEAAERRALAAAAVVVVTGHGTVVTMKNYGVDPRKIVVVEPGVDRPLAARTPAGRGLWARGSSGGPLQLLCVAAVTAGKGHEMLIRALAALPRRDWWLTCAGSLDRDPQAVERVRQLLRETGLEAQVALVGELEDTALEACYDRADVFVLATLSETYGMAVAEAVAHGLPVVSTRTGAIPDLVDVPGGQAGLLVAPGDEQAFGAALCRVTGDPDLRARLAANACRAAARLSTWENAVDRMVSVLNE